MKRSREGFINCSFWKKKNLGVRTEYNIALLCEPFKLDYSRFSNFLAMLVRTRCPYSASWIRIPVDNPPFEGLFLVLFLGKLSLLSPEGPT